MCYWKPRNIYIYKHYKGIWDDKWEYNLTSIKEMRIGSIPKLYSNKSRENTNNIFVVHIGNLERNTPNKIWN